MSDRVLASAEGRQAIQSMREIINGGLVEQIERLNREGETLSQPDVWDGRLAQQFRGEWPDTRQRLIRMKDALEELRVSVEKINQNIMSAGGNA